MKRSIFIFSFFACTHLAFAAGPLGLGVIIGSPTGVSAKYWLSNRTSLDGIVGIGLGHGSSLDLSCDFVWHWTNLTPVPEGKFVLGAGLGGIVIIGDNDFGVGVRGKGLGDYLFADYPISLFLELAPAIVVRKSDLFEITGGLGIRWFFMK